MSRPSIGLGVGLTAALALLLGLVGIQPGGAGIAVAAPLAAVVHGAIGCANSQNPLDIAFPATNGVLSSGNQITLSPPLPTPGAAPGALAFFQQPGIAAGGGVTVTAVSALSLSTVLCGAVFQDTPAVAVNGGADADPNTVDGGTITFTLGAPLYQNPLTAGGVQGGLAQILESNGPSFSLPCGSAATLETCQGAQQGPTGDNTSVSPSAQNVVHVALRPGAAFPLVGGNAPVISLSAAYTRFPALSQLVGAGAGTAALSVGPATIGIVTPSYQLTLTPSPATIPAAAGTGTASTLTATLAQIVLAGCGAPFSPAVQLGGVVACPIIAGLVTTVGGAPTYTTTPGAEAGVVTFSTTSGVFGYPAAAGASGQQVLSVHCGADAGAAPNFLLPVVGQPYSFTFNSCTAVTATLYGGGQAGTAIVTAVYVGDVTGATATAATTVALSAAALTTTLSTGCNEAITPLSLAANASASAVLALVSPASQVVSIWQFNNSLHVFQAFYFSAAGNPPVDLTAVGPNQSLFLCVSGSATFQKQ